MKNSTRHTHSPGQTQALVIASPCAHLCLTCVRFRDPIQVSKVCCGIVQHGTEQHGNRFATDWTVRLHLPDHSPMRAFCLRLTGGSGAHRRLAVALQVDERPGTQGLLLLRRVRGARQGWCVRCEGRIAPAGRRGGTDAKAEEARRRHADADSASRFLHRALLCGTCKGKDNI